MKKLLSLLMVLVAAVVRASEVVSLTPANFDSYVGSKPTMVKFFAPWCGHCKHLAPEYEKAAEKLKGGKVVLAEVDCDANKDLCSRYEVHGYPTVKFFPKGDKKGIEYDGARTADSIVEWIGKNGGRTAPKPRVVSLTPSTFDKTIGHEKDVLVKFFAPWCGHCKRLAPDYEKVAGIFARDSDSLVIAEVDCDANKDLCGRFEVHGYPTLKFFPKGEKEAKEYSGGRAVSDFLSFIKDKTGIVRTEDGFLGAEAGRVKELDEIAAQFLAAEDKEALLAKVKDSEEKTAKIYEKIMEKIIKKGNEFVEKEKARIAAMLESGKVNEKKIDDFTIRKNILAAF